MFHNLYLFYKAHQFEIFSMLSQMGGYVLWLVSEAFANSPKYKANSFLQFLRLYAESKVRAPKRDKKE